MAIYEEVDDVPLADFPGRENVLSVRLRLIELGVRGYKFYFHPTQAISSIETHLAVYGGSEGTVLKCVLLMDEKGLNTPPCCLLMSCDVKWDRRKVKALTGYREPTFASEEVLHRWTGRGPGALDPFSVPPGIGCWIEQRLLEKDWVIGSAGSPYMGLGVPPSEIERITHYPVLNLAKE